MISGQWSYKVGVLVSVTPGGIDQKDSSKDHLSGCLIPYFAKLMLESEKVHFCRAEKQGVVAYVSALQEQNICVVVSV